MICGRSSSGSVKITEIGCSCVMTTMPVGVRRLHVVAGVDLPQPDPAGRPATSMWQ